jgi:hypothetical protein
MKSIKKSEIIVKESIYVAAWTSMSLKPKVLVHNENNGCSEWVDIDLSKPEEM